MQNSLLTFPRLPIPQAYQEKLVESPNADRDKLKTDDSLLQSSDFQVEVNGCIWRKEYGYSMTAYKLLVIISYFLRSCFAPTDIFACIEMHPRSTVPGQLSTE